MKEQLEELLKYLKDAIEFGKEQAPLVAQEILRYAKISNWIYFSIGAALLLVSIFCSFKVVAAYKNYVKRQAESRYEIEEDWGYWFIGIIPTGAFGIGITLDALFTLVQIYVAPRLFLLEYIKTKLL